MSLPHLTACALIIFSLPSAASAIPCPGNEYRALVALESQTAPDQVFLSWRMLADDDVKTSYDIFSQADSQPVKKLNQNPITTSTNFVDTQTCASQPPDHCASAKWWVRINRATETSSACSESATLPSGVDKDKIAINYGGAAFGRALAFGDLTGDGRYEFVLRFPDTDIDPYYKNWRPSSSNTFKLRAFTADGGPLWEYDMGNSIEKGTWYSPYLIYDLDSDGKAELVVKGGDDAAADTALRDETGRVTKGNEYLKVISGADGKTLLAQVDWPNREGFVGDPHQPFSIYNHSSRHQLAIAYLDGQNPHIVVERGTYEKQKVLAYRYDRIGGLRKIWGFENEYPGTCETCDDKQRQYLRSIWGQGAHTIRVGDIDEDGRDEIVIGSFALDHDGEVLWSINKGHLDSIHLGDLDPRVPGLEIYYGAETAARSGGMGMIKAATGEILWSLNSPTSHIHKEGLCADLLAEHPGTECYSGEANRSQHWLWSSGGNLLGDRNLSGPSLSPNAVYWADSPQKLFIARTFDSSADVYANVLDLASGKMLDALLFPSNMLPKDRQYFHVLAYADILGDWREEVLGVARGELVIYMSRIPSSHRLPWLMLDPLYQKNAIFTSTGYYLQPLLGRDLSSEFK